MRSIFPYFLIAIVAAALIWAVAFGTLPRADFTFINGTEVQSVDPAIVTGVPEGRVISSIFEGLYRSLPDPKNPNQLTPQPGVAESHTVSEDGRTYTFTIRKSAQWSNGDPVTSRDFLFTWQRFLHPETPSKYAYQLYYVKNAKQYNTNEVNPPRTNDQGEQLPGDRVEIELADRKDETQLFPRGTIVKGRLEHIEKPPEPKLAKDASEEVKERALADWKRKWVYNVNVGGEVKQFSQAAADRRIDQKVIDKKVSRCLHVLLDFEEVGIKAPDDRTFVVTLNHPTPYFLELAAFYPLFPVHRGCIEKHGSPNWTKAKNIVSNGPFVLEFRRLRDRIRLAKNERYWDANKVELKTIDALAVEDSTTQLNMYLNGQVDWATQVPNSVIPDLMKRPDFISAPMLTTYFYRVNVTRPPLDDHRVRAALNMAIDKAIICEKITRAGQIPARSFVPPGLTGYVGAESGPYDIDAARKLLAEAGFPGGKGFRKIQILYNTNETHRDIAEVIQQQWKTALGIDVELKSLEWGVYLDAVHKQDYDVVRGAWIGDYPDPNTFLDMFVTGGENNETGWGEPLYDKLIADCAATDDQTRRLAMFHDAEAILMDNWDAVKDDKIRGELTGLRRADDKRGGLCLLPIYFYVSINMVQPYVRAVAPFEKVPTKDFFPNIQDIHPLEVLRIDPEEKQRVLASEGRR